MLLAYLDESYDKSNYWIAALLCSDACIVELTEALDVVVAKAAKAYGVSQNAELHGHALFHGTEDWLPVATMARARIGVYNEAFHAIGTSSAEVLIEGVDIARLKKRYAFPDHPHAVVLRHLLERIHDRAKARDELVLAIADDIDAADDHRKSLWHFQRFETGGYKSKRLDRIVDTLHFAPSKASRLVQAADLVAYLNYRITSGRDQDERAIRANTALWQRIEPRISNYRLWLP